jgi:hypothetical protein
MKCVQKSVSGAHVQNVLQLFMPRYDGDDIGKHRIPAVSAFSTAQAGNRTASLEEYLGLKCLTAHIGVYSSYRARRRS